MAAPAAIEERGLVHDIGAGPHRCLGFDGSGAQLLADRRGGSVARDLDDSAAARPKLLEVALLVGHAALGDQLDLGIVPDRLLNEPFQRRALQGEPMLAREEADEVRSRIDRATVDQLHGGISCTMES